MNRDTDQVAMGDAPRRSTSDTELVERVRRNIATLDRWRWALLVFWGLLALGLVYLVVVCVELFGGLNQMAGGQGFLNGALGGFGIGIALGATLGLLILGVVHGLLFAIFGVGRAQRLLVEYHDALQELIRDSGNAER